MFKEGFMSLEKIAKRIGISIQTAFDVTRKQICYKIGK